MRNSFQFFFCLLPILNIWLDSESTSKLKYQRASLVMSDLKLEDSSGSGGSNAGRSYDRPRFGGPRPFKPSPVRVGEEYDVRIESLSKRGDSGVARIQGLVVFVTGTKVGDAVKVKITKVGRGYATAELLGSGSEQSPQPPESDGQPSG
jgi:predicted RNA-binding protein with TRAM domain